MIYGDAGGFNDISLKTLTKTQGFRIYGESSNDQLGTRLSVGDINNDGFDDIFIGANQYSSIEAGKSYVIFGSSSEDNNDPSSKDDVLDNFIKIGIPVLVGLGLLTIGCVAYGRHRSNLEHSLINSGVNEVGFEASKASGYALLGAVGAVPTTDAASIDEENGNDACTYICEEAMQVQGNTEVFCWSEF